MTTQNTDIHRVHDHTNHTHPLCSSPHKSQTYTVFMTTQITHIHSVHDHTNHKHPLCSSQVMLTAGYMPLTTERWILVICHWNCRDHGEYLSLVLVDVYRIFPNICRLSVRQKFRQKLGVDLGCVYMKRFNPGGVRPGSDFNPPCA